MKKLQTDFPLSKIEVVLPDSLEGAFTDQDEVIMSQLEEEGLVTYLESSTRKNMSQLDGDSL